MAARANATRVTAYITIPTVSSGSLLTYLRRATTCSTQAIAAAIDMTNEFEDLVFVMSSVPPKATLPGPDQEAGIAVAHFAALDGIDP